MPFLEKKILQIENAYCEFSLLIFQVLFSCYHEKTHGMTEYILISLLVASKYHLMGAYYAEQCNAVPNSLQISKL